MRAIAALLVLSLHLNETAGVPWNMNQNPLATAFAIFGRTGVILFFVLSGFLLFMPYAKALLFQEEWPSMRKFYLRRIFRIWPAYYFTLAMIILFFNPEYLQPDHWKRLALFLTFFMDSSPKTWQQLDGPFWTLAIEWQFYMLLPWLALCFSCITRRFLSSSPLQRLKIVLSCCSGLVILALSIRYVGLYCQQNVEWSFLVPRSVLNILLFFLFGIQGKYLEVFALGMIISTCYVFTQHPVFGITLKRLLLRLSDWIWRFGIVILLCAVIWHADTMAPITILGQVAWSHYSVFSFIDPLKPLYPWLGEPFAGLGYSICMLAILFGSRELKWLFETRLLRWLGLLSFGLYMWHQKLLIFFWSNDLSHLPHQSSLIVYSIYWIFVIIVIIPLCYMLYVAIEKPGIRIGASLTSKKPEIMPDSSIPSHSHSENVSPNV